jgi:hypothetical protein
VSAGGSDRDVIFEITRVGDVQRIAAIDVATGVEVVVQAPASAALADVRALALKKLERVLTVQPQTPKRPGTLA